MDSAIYIIRLIIIEDYCEKSQRCAAAKKAKSTMRCTSYYKSKSGRCVTVKHMRSFLDHRCSRLIR